MRGEENTRGFKKAAEAEIPPRARRREGVGDVDVDGIGNTSACAEKSCIIICSLDIDRKYLRVRGEEFY